MRDCEMCGSPTRNRKKSVIEPNKAELLCNFCRYWAAYWNGLTPEDRAAEIQAMDDYVMESQREGCF
jgi:ribosome-binding protein aMBF1 (putative translation factor)